MENLNSVVADLKGQTYGLVERLMGENQQANVQEIHVYLPVGAKLDLITKLALEKIKLPQKPHILRE